MKIEKRNNSYRVRKTIDGKTYSINFDHKPYIYEIERRIEEIKKSASSNHEYNFGEATEKYIEVKRNVLSPTTIINYKSVLRNLSDGFVRLKVDRISSIEVQAEINRYASTHSPKSVKNASGVITSVLKMFAPDTIIRTRLPQAEKVDKVVPTEADIRKVLEESVGTSYELFFRLAVFGLRKSEILAVTPKSIQGNCLTIDTAKVKNEDGVYRNKTTKTVAGTRKIYIDEDLARKIKAKGCVYEGYAGNVLRELHRIQKRCNLPQFRLHDFRVYYASWCHANNIPDSYIMDTGGWKSQATLDNIYRKSMPDEMARLQMEIAQKLPKPTPQI